MLRLSPGKPNGPEQTRIGVGAGLSALLLDDSRKLVAMVLLEEC